MIKLALIAAKPVAKKYSHPIINFIPTAVGHHLIDQLKIRLKSILTLLIL
jgi:hypothetical protein